MKKIDIEFSDKEFEAITEYARMCGESLHSLVRKVLIYEITFMGGRLSDDPIEYDHHMLIPDGISNEEIFLESNYNKIRSILGWKEIRL